jgi:exonuclease III
MDFNGLQCFYTNADSLPNKLGELITRIQDGKNSYEVIGITEIYPQNCRYLPGKAELQLEGYELFLSEATSPRKRGAALYVNKKLKAEEIRFNVKFEESIWTQIKLNNKDMLLLGCIYKIPSSSPENLDELNKLLTTVSKDKKFSHIMVMGDINFPKIDWKKWSTKGDKNSENFLESIRDSYLFQHVMENTRMRENCEPSTLDLILTNDENMIEELNYSSPL